MNDQHRAQLAAEVRRLIECGAESVSVPEYYRRWDAAGFRFESCHNIRQFTRYTSGPYTGEAAPELTLYPVHKKLRISAFHVDLPQELRAKVRELRHAFFAVSRDGYILQV